MLCGPVRRVPSISSSVRRAERWRGIGRDRPRWRRTVRRGCLCGRRRVEHASVERLVKSQCSSTKRWGVSAWVSMTMALAWTFAGSVICFFPVGVAWACINDALRRSSVDVVAKIGDRVILGAMFSRMNTLIVATLIKATGGIRRPSVYAEVKHMAQGLNSTKTGARPSHEAIEQNADATMVGKTEQEKMDHIAMQSASGRRTGLSRMTRRLRGIRSFRSEKNQQRRPVENGGSLSVFLMDLCPDFFGW